MPVEFLIGITGQKINYIAFLHWELFQQIIKNLTNKMPLLLFYLYSK